MAFTDYVNNKNNTVHEFKSDLLLARDVSVVSEFGALASAMPSWGTIYKSNGTAWYKSDGTVLAYYTIGITLGNNTSVAIVDSDGNAYVSGDRVLSGAVLTITAAADGGYDLTTYTVNTVNKTADNPTKHTVGANVAIVTAATEQEG